MSLFPKLPPALIRALESLRPRRTDPASPSTDNLWDQPLTGDAWIGVFLIGLSIVSVLVGVQHYY